MSDLRGISPMIRRERKSRRLSPDELRRLAAEARKANEAPRASANSRPAGTAASQPAPDFDPDLFVAWLAETESGSIDRLRSDVAWAADTTTEDASNWISLLEDLGCLKIDWAIRRWSAEPVGVTSLPGRTKVALMTGARPTLSSWLNMPGVVAHKSPTDRGIPIPSTVWFEGVETGENVFGMSVSESIAELAARSLQFLTLESPSPGPSRHTPLAPFDKRSAVFGLARRVSTPDDGLYQYLASWPDQSVCDIPSRGMV